MNSVCIQCTIEDEWLHVLYVDIHVGYLNTDTINTCLSTLLLYLSVINVYVMDYPTLQCTLEDECIHVYVHVYCILYM